jgi:hypothetical protein
MAYVVDGADGTHAYVGYQAVDARYMGGGRGARPTAMISALVFDTT